jgi:hypothetical protein
MNQMPKSLGHLSSAFGFWGFFVIRHSCLVIDLVLTGQRTRDRVALFSCATSIPD